jgi:CubicO group peptidase (beta-lactamase class C family)
VRPVLVLLLTACQEPAEPADPTDPEGTDPVPTTPTTPVVTDEVRAAIADAAEAHLDAGEGSALSIAIWRDGAVIYAEGFGERDPGAGRAVGPDTLFQIGSDTKKITAIAVLQAVSRGELSLAASPTWASEATIRDLISHRGGLYDYTPWDDDPADGALSARAHEVLATEGFAMSPPGAFYNYANPNFSIAALCLEAATGRAWADIVAEDVFAPLGMSRSFARKADIPGDDYATGVGVALGAATTPFDA